MSSAELPIKIRYVNSFLHVEEDEEEADGLQMRAVKSSPAAVKGEGSETFFEDGDEEADRCSYVHHLSQKMRNGQFDASPLTSTEPGTSPFSNALSPESVFFEPFAPPLTAQLCSTDPSPGSVAHPELCRRPCMYFQQGHCENGNACNFCHLDHPEKLAKLDKKQRMLLQSLTVPELVAFLIEFIAERLQQAKLEGTELLQSLRLLAGRLPSLPERDLKNLKKTFARMNLSNLMGVLTHKCSKSGSITGLEEVTEAVENLRNLFRQ